jgi:prolyl oligopeptidase
VTDIYHGVKVVDDYRWLEDFHDPQVKQWAADQNRFTRQYLDQPPGRQQIREQFQSLFTATSSRYFTLYYGAGRLFAMKSQPPKNQFMLVTLSSPDDPSSERVIVDPNQLDPSGTTTIDFYVPSLDGRRVAVSLSKGGSENGTVYVYDVASSKQLDDVLPRVKEGTAGGSVAWNHDGSGFYYTRYPREGERPAADLGFYQQVWFHKLGAPVAQDVYSLGKDFPRIAETLLETAGDGRYVLAKVRNGDGGEAEHWVLGPDGQWKQITKFSDQVKDAVLGRDGALYLTQHLAVRSILDGKHDDHRTRRRKNSTKNCLSTPPGWPQPRKLSRNRMCPSNISFQPRRGSMLWMSQADRLACGSSIYRVVGRAKSTSCQFHR